MVKVGDCYTFKTANGHCVKRPILGFYERGENKYAYTMINGVRRSSVVRKRSVKKRSSIKKHSQKKRSRVKRDEIEFQSLLSSYRASMPKYAAPSLKPKRDPTPRRKSAFTAKPPPPTMRSVENPLSFLSAPPKPRRDSVFTAKPPSPTDKPVTPPTVLRRAPFGITAPPSSKPSTPIERRESSPSDEPERFSPDKAEILRRQNYYVLDVLEKRSPLDTITKSRIKSVTSAFIESVGNDALTLQLIVDMNLVSALYISKNPVVVNTLLDIIQEWTGKRLYPLPGLHDAISIYAFEPSKANLRMLKYAANMLTKSPPKEITFKSWDPERYAAGRLEPIREKLVFFGPYLIEKNYFPGTHCLSVARPRVNEETGISDVDMIFVLESIIKCPYTVIVLQLLIQTKREGHACLLVVNKTNEVWEIERFDPNGASDDERVDVYLKHWFTQAIGNRRFIYKAPIDVCPAWGPQARSELNKDVRGFCQTWTFLYWHLRMDNPKSTGEEVMEFLLSKKDDELYILIQKYMQFMYETDIPAEFVSFLNEKLLIVFSMQGQLQEWTELKDGKIEKPLLDEIRDVWYDWIAKVKDINSCEAFYKLPIYSIVRIFPDPVALRLILIDFVRLLTDRRLKRNVKFENDMLEAMITASRNKDMSLIQNIVNSAHRLYA